MLQKYYSYEKQGRNMRMSKFIGDVTNVECYLGFYPGLKNKTKNCWNPNKVYNWVNSSVPMLTY